MKRSFWLSVLAYETGFTLLQFVVTAPLIALAQRETQAPSSGRES